MENKPVKPPEHKQRYGVGKITRDKVGLYIATNPLILEDFNIDETVVILSQGSMDYFQDSLIYYMDLYIKRTQYMSGVIDGLMETYKKLREENEDLKRLNLELTKTIKNIREER